MKKTIIWLVSLFLLITSAFAGQGGSSLSSGETSSKGKTAPVQSVNKKNSMSEYRTMRKEKQKKVADLKAKRKAQTEASQQTRPASHQTTTK